MLDQPLRIDSLECFQRRADDAVALATEERLGGLVCERAAERPFPGLVPAEPQYAVG